MVYLWCPRPTIGLNALEQQFMCASSHFLLTMALVCASSHLLCVPTNTVRRYAVVTEDNHQRVSVRLLS
jgi:hypothetical protein